MTMWQNMVDVLTASSTRTIVDSKMQIEQPELWEGARPKTHILDINHGLTLAVERSLDDHGRGGPCSADIKQYYDNIDVGACCEYL